MSVLEDVCGPYKPWELSEVASPSQPNVSHACLKLRETKKYVFFKKGDRMITS